MSQPPVRILLVEDNAGDAEIVRRALAQHSVPFDLTVATSLEDATHELANGSADTAAILLDLHLPDSRGIDTWRYIRRLAERTPVVVFTATGDEELGVQAVSEGAQDWLEKGAGDHRLLGRSLRYAIERQRVIEDLRKLQDDMRQFFAHVAHDLRDPVSAVAGLAETITNQRDDLGDSDLDQMLGSVRNQARRLSTLVNDVVDLARADFDRAAEIVSIDVSTMLHQALEDVAPPAGVQVDVEVERPLQVLAEPSRLERVLTNLLTNAYRYGGDHVLLTATATDGRVALTVEDDGAGVPAELVPHLFEEFAQGSNAVREGTGLGLAIVRRFVRAMDGTASYATSPRLGGAQLTITLPEAP